MQLSQIQLQWLIDLVCEQNRLIEDVDITCLTPMQLMMFNKKKALNKLTLDDLVLEYTNRFSHRPAVF